MGNANIHHLWSAHNLKHSHQWQRHPLIKWLPLLITSSIHHFGFIFSDYFVTLYVALTADNCIALGRIMSFDLQCQEDAQQVFFWNKAPDLCKYKTKPSLQSKRNSVNTSYASEVLIMILLWCLFCWRYSEEHGDVVCGMRDVL